MRNIWSSGVLVSDLVFYYRTTIFSLRVTIEYKVDEMQIFFTKFEGLVNEV